ncbi:MAG TPA: mycofactocin biosynthesis glycosyltransferase MftF [Baekduia sp.]|jgi:mycofactocin system glycosyltransferase|nr:mycofactocin biosynthesis glycosyltransferase MftF [Baekduia sp.]
MPPPTGAAALPDPRLRVHVAPGVRVREAGRLVIGGEPLRLMRLAAAGATVLAAWRRGAPVGDAPGAAALARRLLDAGALLSDPVTRAVGDVAVVVPTRDRAPQLARCLRALRHSGAGSVVVVDDGSADAGAVRAAAAAHGAAVVRRERAGGAAAARNAGTAATDAPFVAFVDSDVVVGEGWLQRLRGHFDDPAVGAAAPRVLALEEDDAGSPIAAYELRRSSLDMGAVPASVAPGRRLAYVPSAAVVVRRSALSGGGFDAALKVGEDVDLVWRMVAAGWRVAYDPEARVRHEHRVRPVPFLVRRWDYARSIGPLARRHPDALPALRFDGWTAAVVALVVGGRPAPAAALALVRGRRLQGELAARSDQPGLLAAELSARAYGGAAHGLGHAVRRVWSPPLAAVALAGPPWPRVRARALLAGAFALAALEDRPPTPTAAALSLVDDLIAAFGTWAGAITARTATPLLPRVSRRPA